MGNSAVFQRIAAITHQEEKMDPELLKVINIALYSIGNEVHATEMDSSISLSSNIDMINKARRTYYLIRKVNGIFPTSGTIYTTEYMNKMSLGYEEFLAYVASEASILPKSMYTEVRYVLDQHSILGLMMGYRISGSENLYQKLGEMLLEGMKGEENGSRSAMNGQSMESKMTASFVLQIFESAPLFVSTENLSVESIGEKITPYLKNPALLKEKLGEMQSLYAQRAFNLAQLELIVQSDMGFEISVQTIDSMTMAVSGKMTPKIQAVSPKLEIAGKFIFTGQYITKVGTILPFSEELVLTGVDQHMVFNIPGQVDIQLNIPTQKLSVIVRPHQQSSIPVNMFHFHRYPFTVAQPMSDLTPIYEQPKMKMIHSQTPLRKTKAEFGDLRGLKITAQVETESHYFDEASLLEIFELYNYSPLNVINFYWTLPPLSKTSMPSIRRTAINLIFDPTQSTTKEIGFEIRAGVATKAVGGALTKYHLLKIKNGSGSTGVGLEGPTENLAELLYKLSPYEFAEKALGGSATHPRREQKLKSMLESAPISSEVTGIYLQGTAIIKGALPRAWTSVLAVVLGTDTAKQGRITQIWNIQLERSSGTAESPKYICAKGKLNLPMLPIWSTKQLEVKPIEVQMYSKIGMGVNSCNESSIVTIGQAKVSEEQKSFSQQSAESKNCRGKSGKECELANLQARTLDIIEFNNTFTKVPKFVKALEQTLTTVTKVFLWPFTTKVQVKSSPVSSETFTTHLKMQFQKWSPAVNMTISRPQEELFFSNVRIPYPLSLLVPLKNGSNNLRLASGNLASRQKQLRCVLRKNQINKINGGVIDLTKTLFLDGCYHVLTSKKTGRDREIYGNKVESSFTVSVKDYQDDLAADRNSPRYAAKFEYEIPNFEDGPRKVSIIVKVPVNGQPKATIEQTGQPKKDIIFTNNKSEELEDGTKIKAYQDNTAVSLYLFEFGRFDFDGNMLDMNVWINNHCTQSNCDRLSGLCGNSNLNMKGEQLKGIKTCPYTKPDLEVASQRVQTGSCPQLEGSINAELKQEKAKCGAASFHEVFENGQRNGMAPNY